MRRILLLAVAALMFVGCNNAFEDEGNARFEQNTLPILTAAFDEDATRTYVENNKYLRWHEGDLISVFYGTTLNSQYKFIGNTGANSGEFEPIKSDNLSTGNALDRIYAIYSYDASATISELGDISYTLPSTQAYAEESFGMGVNTMLAVTENLDDKFLAFKNVCGYLKIKLYGEQATIIKSLAIKGNAGEKIAGNATISGSYGSAPVVAMTEGSTDTITINCGEGVELSADAENPTEFWVVVPPTTFSQGITITITDADDAVFEKNTTKEVVVNRNEIQPMAAVNVTFEAILNPASNEILYTSTDGNIVEPFDATVFGATILTNTYADGKGTITFDGDVTMVGEKAFAECNKLSSIAIPDSVTTIGDSAFLICENLTNIKLGDGITTIGEAAFSSCAALTKINIPDSVTTIGVKAFFGCRSLTNVYLGKSVETIGQRAFYYCNNLASINIPDSVTTIGMYSFYDCDKLATISFGDGVSTIETYAFYSCDALTTVTLGKNVTTIEDNVFNGCSVLKNVYCKAVTPPVATYTIAWNCFENNAYDRKIYVPAESVKAYRMADGWLNYADEIYGYDFINGVIVPDTPSSNEIWYTATEKVEPSDDMFGVELLSNEFNAVKGKGVLTFDGDVTVIGERAFERCNTLTGVTLPKSVTTIGDYAFSYCTGLLSMTMPNSVTVIGNYAFNNCTGLRAIHFGTGVQTIGAYAFNNCNSLSNVAIGVGVTSIGDFAFYYCDNLKEMTISDSVTTMGENPFRHCSRLIKFNGKFASKDGRCLIMDGVLASFAPSTLFEYVIPEGVTTIGNSAFRDCDNLNEITIPEGVTAIGNFAFSDCDNIESITIPDSVLTIGDGVFFPCGKLTTVTLGNGLTAIGNSAFRDCENLIGVTIPDSVTTVGEEAFYYCSNLKEAIVGDGVTSIGSSAFRYCENLERVTIGASVSSIGYYAFLSCAKLETLYCKPVTPPTLERSVFIDTNLTNIYVPTAAVNTYKEASEWKEYADVIIGYTF